MDNKTEGTLTEVVPKIEIFRENFQKKLALKIAEAPEYSGKKVTVRTRLNDFSQLNREVCTLPHEQDFKNQYRHIQKRVSNAFPDEIATLIAGIAVNKDGWYSREVCNTVIGIVAEVNRES